MSSEYFKIAAVTDAVRGRAHSPTVPLPLTFNHLHGTGGGGAAALKAAAAHEAAAAAADSSQEAQAWASARVFRDAQRDTKIRKELRQELQLRMDEIEHLRGEQEELRQQP